MDPNTRRAGIAAVMAILAMLGLAACASGRTESMTPTSLTCGGLNLSPTLRPTSRVLIHFKDSATKAEMVSFANELDSELSSTTFSEIPNIDFCYEQYHFLISWSSPEAALRAEERLRALAKSEMIVDRVELLAK